MVNYTRVNLELLRGSKICINEGYLEEYKQALTDFLISEDYMKTLAFAKNMMMSQEIKANNMIEGITDDLMVIDEVINNKGDIPLYEKMRIVNLYHGYQYILTHTEIDKIHLKELYDILSDGILDEYGLNNMGPFYRTKPVYILKGRHLDRDPYLGVPYDKIDYYMDLLFDYINDGDDKNGADNFVKSQVMHFYFTYIHPYFDVNGRTSRTVSMWYLVKNQNFPYIIFNRAIAFAKEGYEENIIKARPYGDVTLFLKYMLEHVLIEFEKEHVIHSIKSKINEPLSKEEVQMIEYFLIMKGNLTAKDLARIYNDYNEPKKSDFVVEKKIMPLLEKGFFIDTGLTGKIKKGHVANFGIRLNSELLDIKDDKVKHLKLDRFVI